MPRKRITRRKLTGDECTGKLLIDRFFEYARNDWGYFAFQNIPFLQRECLEKFEAPFLITERPKRKYFEDNGKDPNILVKDGFNIYFNCLTNDEISKVKYKMISEFGKRYFVKVIKDDTRSNPNKNSFGGVFRVTNLQN